MFGKSGMSVQYYISVFALANYENNTLIRVCFSTDHQSQSWMKLNLWELYLTISYQMY